MANLSPMPWEYVPGNQFHGPYITTNFGTTICDLYEMSAPHPVWSSETKPINFCGEEAEANAAFIVHAVNLHDEMVEALKAALPIIGRYESEHESNEALTVHAMITAALSKSTPTQEGE